MIDYSLIHESILFYKENGYARVESPWTVTPAIAEITKPTEVPLEWKLNHNGKVLVASGEQSFLYMYLKEFLPEGKFQTVTPCFRSDMFDQQHTKYFVKNELIETGIVNSTTVEVMLKGAMEFFSERIPEKLLEIKQNELRRTSDMKELCSYDIVAKLGKNEVELGSYGLRECSFLKWAYGTGCAEPRMSHALKRITMLCL